MKIKPFELERYFAKYEFTAPYLLCSSDCEPIMMDELLTNADKESLHLWENLSLGYTDSAGHPLLREEVSNLYKNKSKEDILVVTPEEGIYIAMNTQLNKGDHIICPFPGYQSLFEVANSIGCQVSYWIPDFSGVWTFDIDKLFSLVKPETRMIVLNFPHNPTGSVISEENAIKILSFANDHNIAIFSDEMYRFLEHDENIFSGSLCDLSSNVVSLFGMSKSFGLAGLRIGWLVSENKKLIQECSNYKDYTTICSSAPSEILALMGLRSKKQLLQRSNEIILNNLKLLDTFFLRFNKIFSWTKPLAGPIAFPKLLLDKPVFEFCEDLVNKKGVMLLPSDIYDFDGNFFRIGFGRKNMPVALEKFEEYISELS